MYQNIYIQQKYIQEIHNPKMQIVFICTIVVPMLLTYIVRKAYRKPILSISTNVFSLYVIYAMTLLERVDSGVSQLNLDLLWTWKKALAGSQQHQYFIIGNILLFIPFGITMTLSLPVSRRKWWIAMLVGGMLSILIELTQYFQHLGLCELDDVFHNTIGMVIGYGIAKGSIYIVAKARKNP